MHRAKLLNTFQPLKTNGQNGREVLLPRQRALSNDLSPQLILQGKRTITPLSNLKPSKSFSNGMMLRLFSTPAPQSEIEKGKKKKGRPRDRSQEYSRPPETVLWEEVVPSILETKTNSNTITISELDQLLQQNADTGKYVLIDLRGEDEYEGEPKISNAASFPGTLCLFPPHEETWFTFV